MSRVASKMRRLRLLMFLSGLLVAGLLIYANAPHPPLLADTRADRIVVRKSQRTLALFQNGQLLRTYSVALGRDPVGAKQQEGDGRTPEGLYTLDYRNPRSTCHLSLHVSYPSPADTARAAARGVGAGSLIMVHGLRNGLGLVGQLHRLLDWTNGCIAVTNPEIREIWRVVPDGTPILIKP